MLPLISVRMRPGLLPCVPAVVCSEQGLLLVWRQQQGWCSLPNPTKPPFFPAPSMCSSDWATIPLQASTAVVAVLPSLASLPIPRQMHLTLLLSFPPVHAHMSAVPDSEENIWLQQCPYESRVFCNSIIKHIVCFDHTQKLIQSISACSLPVQTTARLLKKNPLQSTFFASWYF